MRTTLYCRTLLLFVIGMIWACPAVDRGADAVIRAPATYTGVIPCADCEGIRLTLNLGFNHTFVLRQSYLGTRDGLERSFYDLGRWVISDNGNTLSLYGSTQAPRTFAVVDKPTLRMLDTMGREIDSTLNYELVRSEAWEPFEDSFLMRGMYIYMGDTDLFTECFSGKTFPVATEGDNQTLETAYLHAQKQIGQSVLTTLEGHFAMRRGMEGGGQHEVLVVDQLRRLEPGETCETRKHGTGPHDRIAASTEGRAIMDTQAGEGKRAFLPSCPSTPNCVSSDAADETHRVKPYRLTAEPAEAWKTLKKIVVALPRTTIRTATQDYLKAEVRSRIFRFVDDLEFQLRADENIIAVRSASRVGYSDLGVNRRRVEKIRELLISHAVAE